jgi:hypothetical protein
MSAPVALLIFLCAVVVLMLFSKLVDELRVRRIRQPQFFYEQQGDDPMTDSLTYTIVAAPVVDGDVVERLLTIVVNGEDQGTAAFPATATELSAFTVPQDANVVLTLVDVDDAGNKSAPAVVEFVAVDTLPPAQPGVITVTLVGEKTNSPSDEV